MEPNQKFRTRVSTSSFHIKYIFQAHLSLDLGLCVRCHSNPVENASDEEERERTKKDRSQAVLSRHEIETMAHDKTRVFISGVPHRTPSNCTGLNTMQSDLVFLCLNQ